MDCVCNNYHSVICLMVIFYLFYPFTGMYLIPFTNWNSSIKETIPSPHLFMHLFIYVYMYVCMYLFIWARTQGYLLYSRSYNQKLSLYIWLLTMSQFCPFGTPLGSCVLLACSCSLLSATLLFDNTNISGNSHTFPAPAMGSTTSPKSCRSFCW